MKKLYNYLESEGYTIHKFIKNKKVFGFKYAKDMKILFGINVEYKEKMYNMNFTDYREREEGELEFVTSPYIMDIIDFLEDYKTKRFRELVGSVKK